MSPLSSKRRLGKWQEFDVETRSGHSIQNVRRAGSQDFLVWDSEVSE